MKISHTGMKVITHLLTIIESNLFAIINKEKVLNSSDEFASFLSELSYYTKSFVFMINNQMKIFEIFQKKLIYDEYFHSKNYILFMSILELFIGFIKDIRTENIDFFLTSILPELIKFIKLFNLNVEVIDKMFNLFANVFKFMHKGITRNFQKFFLIFSDLLFLRNKFIRKFSCESICFLIKNLEDNQFFNLSIIFEVFLNPSKYFDISNPEAQDEEQSDKINNSQENHNNLKGKLQKF